MQSELDFKEQNMGTQQYIKALLAEISKGLYEKDNILALSLLCAISGESLFLLGPPGTAKSEVARRLKLIFKNASSFEYLMSRFSTPDEIFGPVSIQKLKSEDTYERKVDGFLPSATIVFLDEIWKAGPAIQNSLLTVINERIYQNGTHTIQLPMKCLIAASNELPAEDEGLEALWDRFLVRVVSNCIEDERTFYKMLTMADMPIICIPDNLLLTSELYTSWQKGAKSVGVSTDILSVISAIRKALTAASKEENVDPFDYYISDRRWRKNINLLRTSAFLNDRTSIDYSDIILLIHSLWNKVSCIESILNIVTASIFADINSIADSIEVAYEKELKRNTEADSEEETSAFKKFNYFYLALKDHPKGKCFFFESDYKYVPKQGDCPAIMYFDENLRCYVIRKYDNYARAFGTSGKQNVTMVKISKYNGALLIDGIPYQIVRNSSEISSQEQSSKEGELMFVSPLVSQAEMAINALHKRWEFIKSSQNIFVSKNDLKLVGKTEMSLEKRLKVLLAKSKNL